MYPRQASSTPSLAKAAVFDAEVEERGRTMALEMSDPYTSAPFSARGMDSEPVPQPAADSHAEFMR